MKDPNTVGVTENEALGTVTSAHSEPTWEEPKEQNRELKCYSDTVGVAEALGTGTSAQSEPTVGVAEALGTETSAQSEPTCDEQEERVKLKDRQIEEVVSGDVVELPSQDEPKQGMVEGAVMEPSPPASEHPRIKPASTEQEGQSADSSASRFSEAASEQRSSATGQDRDQLSFSQHSGGELSLLHRRVECIQKPRVVFDRGKPACPLVSGSSYGTDSESR